jgi:type IV pilus assembly protein PilC
VPRKELIQFCMHMEQCLASGLTVPDSLADFIEDVQSARFKTALSVINESIKAGATLGRALDTYPKIFSDVYRGLIRAGESAGTLPSSFERLARDLRWQDEMTSKVKKAMMYPLFTFAVIAGVAVFLLTYLVPQLTDFIRSMGQKLPWNTELLLASSALLVKHGWVILGGLVASILGCVTLLRIAPEGVRLQLDRVVLRLPLVGAIIEKAALARYASVLGMLYASGVPIMDALATARDSLGNRWLARSSERVADALREGQTLSASFEAAQAFPKLVIRSVRIGEATGRIDQSLQNVTYFFEREVNETLDRLQSLIEPIMTVGLGLLLGFLMISVLGPVYDMLGKIKA